MCLVASDLLVTRRHWPIATSHLCTGQWQTLSQRLLSTSVTRDVRISEKISGSRLSQLSFDIPYIWNVFLRKLLSRVPIEATTWAKVQSKNDLKLRLSVYLITVYLIIRKFSNPFISLHFINVVTLRIYIMYFGKYADLYKFDVTAYL